MNKEEAKGTWNQFAGKVKHKWGRLTDNDVMLLKGNRQEFYGKLQQQYGLAKEEADRQLREIEKSCNYSAAA